MKHLRKLKLREKKRLKEEGYNPDEYYHVKVTQQGTVFFNAKKKQVITV